MVYQALKGQNISSMGAAHRILWWDNLHSPERRNIIAMGAAHRSKLIFFM